MKCKRRRNPQFCSVIQRQCNQLKTPKSLLPRKPNTLIGNPYYASSEGKNFMRTVDVKSVLHKTTFRNEFTITFTLNLQNS